MNKNMGFWNKFGNYKLIENCHLRHEKLSVTQKSVTSATVKNNIQSCAHFF